MRIFVILNYVKDENDTYAKCFATKELALRWVQNGILVDLENEHRTVVKDGKTTYTEGKQKLTGKELAWVCHEQVEATKSLNETGTWTDKYGNTYTLEEHPVLGTGNEENEVE